MNPSPKRREPEQVCSMFDSLVSCYDRLNRTMTLGMDRSWRRQLRDSALKQDPKWVLDLASGTGDVALLFQESGVRVTAGDFCPSMLKEAERKGVKDTQIVEASALPFTDASFDAVTVAWGFRNFQDRQKAAQEVYRVLRPGGGFFILESSEPRDWTRPFYRLYCRNLIPRLGQFISGNRSAYRYLVETMADFPPPDELAGLLTQWGYHRINWKTMGLGAVCLHQAFKPA
ncbi:MAG: ubiquinone/menaquinone biosynthesis methyltransferase [Verrucomicrobiota bacterium]